MFEGKKHSSWKYKLFGYNYPKIDDSNNITWRNQIVILFSK